VCPNLERRFPTFNATRVPVSRSKVNATRPINTDAHRAPYLPNGKAYELQTWYTDGGRRPASATGAMTSKVKVTRSRDQSEPSWPNAVSLSLAAGGGIPCRPNPAAALLVIIEKLWLMCDAGNGSGGESIYGGLFKGRAILFYA